VTSGRGSVFVLCALSRTDQRFPRYPHLPVLTCNGFVRGTVVESAPPSNYA
jgi:hypothetical protein